MGAISSRIGGVMKAGLKLVYPPQCPGCGGSVSAEGQLCPDCWRDAELIGTACSVCAVPLVGAEQDELSASTAYRHAQNATLCEDCALAPHEWDRGRAAMVYDGTARRMVLALKHGDRPDLAVALGRWLAMAAGDLICPDTLIIPIPLHLRRFMRRRYNQAALLAAAVQRHAGGELALRVLCRPHATPMQGHRTAVERAENLRDAFAVPTKARAKLAGRPVLLVDDVMASGATLDEATRCLRHAGAGRVNAVVFARAVKARGLI